jgi:hypothetical protein
LSIETPVPAKRRGLSVAASIGACVALGAGGLYAGLKATPREAATPPVQRVVIPLASVTPAQPVVPTSSPEDTLSRMASAPQTKGRDLDCLTQAVYFEARGESARGQAAVAQVVLNRVRHPAFPKSVCGVVYQGAGARSCQFSFACGGAPGIGRENAAWRKARQVAKAALSGAVVAEVGQATHFHTTGVTPQWGPRLLRVAQVGVHVFYRLGAGSPQAVFGARHDRPVASDVILTGLMAQPAAAVQTLSPSMETTLAQTTFEGVAPAPAQAAAVAPPAVPPSPAAAPQAVPASAAAPAGTLPDAA